MGIISRLNTVKKLVDLKTQQYKYQKYKITINIFLQKKSSLTNLREKKSVYSSKTIWHNDEEERFRS